MNTGAKEIEIGELPVLPEGWEWVRFGILLGELRNGISTKPELSQPGFPILRISAVRSGSVSLNEHRFLPRGADLLAEYGLRDGDLLFTRYNGSLELLGVCGMVRGLGTTPLLYPDKLMRVRFDHGHVLPAYAELFFQSAAARDRLTAQSRSSAGQQGISGGDIKSQPFALPPFREQQRLVEAIEAARIRVDAACHHLSRVPAILTRFRQAVLAAACSGGLTEDWRSSNSDALVPLAVSRTPPTLPDDELPDLPEGWVWTTVGSVAASEKNSITDGPFGSNLKTEHYMANGPRVIRLQNIGDYRFVDLRAHISREHFDLLAKHQIQAGDVAIACLGDPVPRACEIPSSVGPAIVKADCVRFKPNPSLANQSYLCYVLNDSATRLRMSEIVHGVGRARLNLQQIKSIPVPLPPLAEQVEIVRRVESMLRLHDEIANRVTLAAEHSNALKQSILAKAFRGELVPTEAELARREGRDYEPASVLLERIRAERANKAKSPPVPKRTMRRASAHV